MEMIAVNTPLLNGNEKKYLNECIETGWISSEGPFVKALEDNLAKRVNRQYGIAVCNGTVALELALKALKIGKNDEVILPTFTIISCILAVIRVGATPVLVDCDPLTWNMTAQHVEKKITSKTRALMIVHLYGLPVEMEPILLLAKKHNLLIIEDAAQMHGQTYLGQPCGSFGEISTFSFYPNKLVTTGEGGMVLVNDEALAEQCRSLRNLTFQSKKRYYHEEMGWNFRMSNLQAAVGVAQLERLDDFILHKRRIGKLYTELLSENKELQLPIAHTPYADNIYWVYGIVLKNVKAQSVMQRLKEIGVDTRAFFYPMHQQPIFKKQQLFVNEKYPVAEHLAEYGFYLPSGLGLTLQQVETVAYRLKDVLKEFDYACV